MTGSKVQSPRSKVALLELTAAQLAQLDALNASAPGAHRIEAVARPDGGHVLAADLLTDCGAGQTFEHFGEFLKTVSREGGEGSEVGNPKSPILHPQSKISVPPSSPSPLRGTPILKHKPQN